MKNKGTILFSFMPVVLLASMLRTAPLKMAVVSGDLIKGSFSAVYYLGSDNKRYVFPNDKVYFTWYTDFSSVQIISDTALANYPLGGNITYRPGMHLVKIQSDPKVYAVGAGGVLHWVSTAAVASSIFGSDWARKVDDIADAFFVNYTIGSPLYSVSDYNPSSLAASDYSINVDKRLSTAGNNGNNNASGSSASVSISLSPYSTTLLNGQYTTATASAYDPDGLSTMGIYVNGALTQTCPIAGLQTNGLCSLNVYASNYSSTPTISVYAQATDRYGNVTASSTTTLSTQNGTNTNNATVSLSLSPYSTMLTSGQTTTVTANAYDPDGLTAVGIYVNGSLNYSCPISGYPANGSCSVSLSGGNYTGSANITVFAQATDRYGSVSTSSTSTLTTQYSNSSTSGSVSLSLSPYATTLASGQSTTVSASAFDADGLTAVAIYVNGSQSQNCPIASYPSSGSCTVNLYGSNYANGATVSVYAQETDRYGTFTTSPVTTLTIGTGGGSSNGGTVSVSLSPYAITLASGQFTTVSALATDPSGLTSIAIYVNGSLSQNCPISGYLTSGSCTVNLYGSNYANGTTLSVYAQSVNRYSGLATSSTATLAVQGSGTTNNGSAGFVSVTLSPYTSTLASGQSTTISAVANDPSGLREIDIYVNGALSQSCPISGYPGNGTCTLTVYGNNYASGTTLSIYAQATNRYSSVDSSSSTSITVQGQSGASSGNSYVTLSLSPNSTTLLPGASNTVTANAYAPNGLTSIGIYVNGTLSQTCSVGGYSASGSCTVVLYGSNYANGSTISISAQAVDRYSNITTATTTNLSI